MNKKLSDWASIAEIGSGFAVVVTLVILVVGINENTSITRVSVYSDIIEGFNETERQIFADPELAQIADAYWSMDTKDLTEAQIAQVTRIGLTTLRNLEKAYFARQYGVIGDDEWRRMEASMCFNSEAAESAGMPVRDVTVLTEQFREYVDRICEID